MVPLCHGSHTDSALFLHARSRDSVRLPVNRSILLRIGDDPSEVYFNVRIPSLDVSANDLLRLHQTAVAQVFAFTVHAAREAAPTQDWHRRRDRLNPWKVDLQTILRAMPESIRTDVSCSDYVPSRSIANRRSAMNMPAAPPCKRKDRTSPRTKVLVNHLAGMIEYSSAWSLRTRRPKHM